MPWFRIDDTFADHPKVTNAGNAAAGLWVRCGTYSSRFLLDGVVPNDIAKRYGSRREIERLLMARLWLPCDGGFVMPDFLDYNPSAEQVRLDRKRAAEKKRRQRENVDRSPNGQYVSLRESLGDRP
jgi:hypothetical protein